MYHLRRTVIISLGDEATALAAELATTLDLPVVAHVALDGGPTDAGALLAALAAVSAAAAVERLSAMGVALERTDEIAAWLLVDIAAAARLPALIEARQEALELAWRHFRCSLPTQALVISAPEAGAATEALAQALEVLPQPLESLWLVGRVNADGLSLAADEARARLREALRQLIVSPLRHLPRLFAPPPPWSDVWAQEGIPGRCGAGRGWQTPPALTLGAQFYPNPAGRLWLAFVRRWLGEALGRLAVEGVATEPGTGWVEWQPDRLGPLLAGVMGPGPQLAVASYARPGWGQVGALGEQMVEDEARAGRLLGQATAAGVAELAVWARRWQGALDSRLGDDLTPTGELPDLGAAGRALVSCREQWLGWAAAMDGRLERLAVEQDGRVGRRDAARARVAGLAGGFPLPGWGGLWRWLAHPRRWGQGVRAYVQLDAGLAAYVEAANAVVSGEMERRCCDLLRQFYLVGAEAVGRLAAMVEGLAAMVRQAQAAGMAAPGQAAPGMAAPGMADAVLDEAACDRLYGEVMGDGLAALGRFLAQKPLVWRTAAGEWQTYAGAETLVAEMEAFAGRWLEPLLAWGADRFAAFALGDDEERLEGWLKALWLGAAPLWPTGGQVCGPEGEVTALVVAEPEDSPLTPLARGWREGGDWQVVRARVGDAVVVMRVGLLSEV
ncbi:MAG: hypothetical protein K1X65_21275 [Caldilineales bacterium]|nr:hypothetical protein [Caldilineales bacterium]